MKKLINKLFEWLGYVPKEEYERVKKVNEYYRNNPKKVIRSVLAHEQAVLKYDVTFFCQPLNGCYIIFQHCKETDDNMPVKAFPFVAARSEEHARIRAEKICDMLNEKY